MTIFGLGNPTRRYALTRHNAGFMVTDELARRLDARFRPLPWRLVATTKYVGVPLHLVKPTTYMNESGIAVKEQLLSNPDEFMVVIDDIALPFGRIRLRPAGSDGGHKGLASVIYHLGRDDFPRLRIGIGSPPPGCESTQYVLEPFTSSEMSSLPEIIARAADACLVAVSEGLSMAMNRFNPECCASGRGSTTTEQSH
ncbi:MAG: aminoacyl-tRNA hydrolase [candidate division WOR-3 bacterium]